MLNNSIYTENTVYLSRLITAKTVLSLLFPCAICRVKVAVAL
jgi:hypothetical protein